MQEEWASKSSRVQRERAFRDARTAARSARLYPHGVPAGAERSDRKAELQRRASIGGVGLLGAMALFRLTGPLDRALEWPTSLVYALTGVVAGGVFGALAKAESPRMRVLQIFGAAIVVGAVFALLANAEGRRIYWWHKW